MTFSLVGRCAETGMVGVAVCSSSPAVAARCAYTRAGVGAVASQNVTDPRLGPLALDHMADGLSAAETVAAIQATGQDLDYRQILVIDRSGGTALHSGPRALGIWSGTGGTDCLAAGNLLANAGVPGAMVRDFERAQGHLGDRLMAALAAGRDAGGEAGPVHSAGLQLADAQAWPYADLRCDWTEGCPIAEVARAWEVYRPQADDYVRRALEPAAAPSYNVPGDA